MLCFYSSMTWFEHVDFLKNKIRRCIYAFRQPSEVLNEREIQIAYYACVQS